MQSELLNRLGDVLREVAQREIAPRFQKLAPSDVIGKPTADDPSDLVTAADRAAEAELTLRLPELVPGSSVVGEFRRSSVVPLAVAGVAAILAVVAVAVVAFLRRRGADAPGV
jgi:fructose-1,6-bisphosphatase/inositol monophosphatase family enzyme